MLYERSRILREFKKAIENERSGAWESCFLALEARQTDNWENWADELTEILGKKTRQSAYDRAHAAYMFNELEKDHPGSAVNLAKKGYSYFKECYPHYQSGVMSGLVALDAIATADTIEELRIYLSNRYGETEPMDRIAKQFASRYLPSFLGSLETLRAPQPVRDAAKALKDALKEWLG